MKTSSKIKKNYLFNVAYQIFAIIVPLITTPYVSRVLSANGIGIYSFTYAIIRYFIIFAVLGSNNFGIREMGKYQDDRERRSTKFWNIFTFKLINSVIMIVIYLVYVALFATDKIIAFVQVLYLINVIFDISWFYQGMDDFKKISIRNFIIKLINIIFIFIFIKDENDLLLYVFGLAFFTVLGGLSMWINIRKYIDKPNPKKIQPFEGKREILQLFFPTIATQMYSIIDKTMIGFFTTTAVENGYYEQSLKIIDMSLTIITSLSAVMIPTLSKEYKEKKYDSINSKMIKTYKFIFILGIPMMFGIIGISDRFVPLFFGTGYEKVKILLPVMSLLYLPMCINHATGVQYLVSTGQQNKYSKYLICGGIINVLLNTLLIPEFQSVGAAIGSIIGEIVIMIMSISYIKKTKQLNINLLSYAKKYFIFGIIMFIPLIFLNFLNISNILFLCIAIPLSIFIYLLLLLITKDEIVTSLIIDVKRKINKFIAKKT